MILKTSVDFVLGHVKEVELKDNQLQVLEAAYEEKDCVAVLSMDRILEKHSFPDTVIVGMSDGELGLITIIVGLIIAIMEDQVQMFCSCQIHA